jgi:crotonobetainyl-CoA:carnitine CoA-transferase CaiB-like acyl-CoA transferase
MHAGGQAAQGAMIALYHREMTGEGQFVDVSIQDSVTRCSTTTITGSWDYPKRIVRRGGEANRRRVVWPCKDGYVLAQYWSGQYANRRNSPIVNWIESEGAANDFIREFDWNTYSFNADPDMAERIAEPTLKLFTAHTKTEILEGALKHNAQVYPIATTADIAENPQLAARGFWVELEHPELGTTITYPGPFANTTEAIPKVSRRAPLIGEHNQEIYEKELGFSKEKIVMLKQAKVI